MEFNPDPKRGALTQIVAENTPPGLHKIVPDIASPIKGELFDRTYEYVRENY